MEARAFIFQALIALVIVQLHFTNAARQGRIVNGNEAQVGEIPHQVSIQTISSNIHDCGGSILNDHWVVTAAHCLEGMLPAFIQIMAGSVDLKSPYTVHRVAKIITHENWDEDNDYPSDDIALIKVVSPFKFSRRIQPVKLPKPHEKIETNSSAVASGWGYKSEDEEEPDLLQKVTVYIVDQKICNDHAKQHSKFYKEVRDTNICAYDPPKIKGICNGDSGGPLTADGVLIGIVSWNIADLCDKPYPNVFTRVSEYVDWIYKHINSTHN